MENKLTDNEIIKALECCGAGKYHCLRELCPKFRDNATTTVSECREVLMKDTIDLINRQKAEIERLKDFRKDGFFNLIGNCLVYSKNLKDYNDMRKGLKSEAIKEFAERLKEKRAGWGYPLVVLKADDIDNLIKEWRAKNMGRKPGRKPKIVQSAKPPKKSSLTLDQIAKLAADEGMHYGDYVVKYGL